MERDYIKNGEDGENVENVENVENYGACENGENVESYGACENGESCGNCGNNESCGNANAKNSESETAENGNKDGSKNKSVMPRSATEIYAKIVIMIAIVFGAFGVLSLAGIVDVENSQKILAFAVAVGSAILWKYMLNANTRKFEKLENLQKSGELVVGTVTVVEFLKSMHCSNQTPFCVHYQYMFSGVKYSGESEFLWEKPLVLEGEELEVFVDVKNPKISFSKDFF